jgi:transcriptional regulator with XRE-family HTH domain
MDALSKAVGDRVRQRRKKLGLTQEELAGRAGIDTSYVGQLERGLRHPSLRVLACVAEALEMQVADLLREKPRQDSPVLRELQRTLGTLPPAQQQAILEIVKKMAGLLARARGR